MALIQVAVQNDQPARIVQLLRSVIPESELQEDLRDFEWYYLWRKYHGEESRLRGHTGSVTAVAFSPDERCLASASADRTVKIWDLNTGKALLTFEGHTDRVTSIAFSPDGKLLVSGATDKSLIVWDAATGHSRRNFDGHQGGVNCVAFSPDGRLILSGSDDKTVRVWDVNSGEMKLRFGDHTFPVRALTVSPNGGRIGSVSYGGNVSTLLGEALIWAKPPETLHCNDLLKNQRR